MFLDDLGQAIANPTCGIKALAVQEPAGRVLLFQLDRDSVRVRVLRSTGVSDRGRSLSLWKCKLPLIR